MSLLQDLCPSVPGSAWAGLEADSLVRGGPLLSALLFLISAFSLVFWILKSPLDTSIQSSSRLHPEAPALASQQWQQL